MRRLDKDKNLRPSILDRLLDDEPHLQVEPEVSRHQRIRELRNSVRRDLEALLNSRYRLVSPPDEFTELQHSLVNYGLPDLATVNITDIDKKRAFIRDLERVLKIYEPRFKSVKVSYQDNKDKTDRTLRFRIDATLYADPTPEVVIFDSVLEPASRMVNVEEANHG